MTRLIVAMLVVASLQVDVTVSQLESEPDTWNERAVIVTGEIVGDYSIRTDYVWFQINDDAYATTPLEETGVPTGTNTGIGVRVDRALFDLSMGEPGGYDVRGPLVRINAVYHHNSATHQGETFLEAQEIELIQPSRAIEIPVGSPYPALIGATLLLVGILSYLRGRYQRAG